MVKIVRYLTCILFFTLFIQSCTEPESVEKDITERFSGDTATIHLNNDFESYITGKCVMLSFEKQYYSIPYTQVAVDSAYADADWISIFRHSTYVTVVIKENYIPEYRNCYAYYRLTGSEHFDSLIVSQGPKDTFFITSNARGRLMDYKQHELFFDVFSNVEYTVEIPDSAKEWIRQITPKKTKSIFADSRFGITVLANDGDFREAYVSIKSKKSNESQSVRIAQDCKHYTIDGVIADNPEISIFNQALISTGLNDSLQKYLDYTYPGVSYEWTLQAAIDDAPNHHWHSTSVEKHEREVMPEERKFMFTVFCVKDAILNDYNDDYCKEAGLAHGIQNYNDLVKYAEAVYPEGKGLPHNDRASSINKLISYHILPYYLTYDQFNTSAPAIVKKYNAVYTKVGEWSPKYPVDVEDFFSTLLPHSIMRISTPWQGMDGTPTRRGGIFINRKGVEGVKETTLGFPGTRIAEESEYDSSNTGHASSNKAVNGIYHYVDGLLLYDRITREEALFCRMRIMACTLSPDFVNSGGRGRMRDQYDIVYCYYPEYCDNFDWIEGSGLYVRYRDPNFGYFNGDVLTIKDNYDISVKIPSVPTDGVYELRFLNNAISGLGEGAADRGIVQFFSHEASPQDKNVSWRNWDWEPEGIPVDLRITGDDGRIGMVLDNDAVITNLPENEQQKAIDANDRAMRSRGYMKAPDSWGGLRTDKNCWRKIVFRRYMKADKDYYLRMRQLYTDGTGVLPLGFIEIVPEDLWLIEDKH